MIAKIQASLRSGPEVAGLAAPDRQWRLEFRRQRARVARFETRLLLVHLENPVRVRPAAPPPLVLGEHPRGRAPLADAERAASPP